MGRRWIKVLAVLLLIAGAASIGTSLYITKQVEEGNIQIQSAEESVKKGDQLFSLIPQTKEIGKTVTDSANKKISAGKETIAHYTAVAQNLKVLGIVLCVLGIALFFIPKKKK